MDVSRWFARPNTVTHPSTNRARRRITDAAAATPTHQCLPNIETRQFRHEHQGRVKITHLLNTGH